MDDISEQDLLNILDMMKYNIELISCLYVCKFFRKIANSVLCDIFMLENYNSMLYYKYNGKTENLVDIVNYILKLARHNNQTRLYYASRDLFNIVSCGKYILKSDINMSNNEYKIIKFKYALCISKITYDILKNVDERINIPNCYICNKNVETTVKKKYINRYILGILYNGNYFQKINELYTSLYLNKKLII